MTISIASADRAAAHSLRQDPRPVFFPQNLTRTPAAAPFGFWNAADN